MKVTIIGTAYVGLVTGVSLAAMGHNVICVGRNKDKIKKINDGKAPFFEPGLDDILKKLTKKNSIYATDNLSESIGLSEVVIISVGTPTVDSKIDLSEIKEVSKQIGKTLKDTKNYRVIVVKSTVVPGTTENIIKPLVEKYSSKKAGKDFGLCMNPEFLREGNALEDALEPDRIVIGQYDKRSGEECGKLYKKVKCPIVVTNLKTAEMTKYAANALFATLISFSNEIARISEKTGKIDVLDVWKGVHLDKRLSPVVDGKRISPGILSYILSGCGYGGSCFPKDTKALYNFSTEINEEARLIKDVIDINNTQPNRIITLLKKAIGENLTNKKVVLLGLTFKPDSDDLRESAAFPIIEKLLSEKAKVTCHDPRAYLENIPPKLKILDVVLSKTIEEALQDADAAILVTAWKEYKNLKPQFFLKYMKQPVLVDGRRVFDKNKFRRANVVYAGIGLS